MKSTGADILVVDDEADIRDLVSGLLEDEGHAVRTAANSDEALAAIRAGGYAALPVVALTADAMAGERDRLLALGFDGYVSKPIDPAELISALGAALDPAPGDDRRACA